MPAKITAVLSTSLLLASACTDPSDIGLELSPENNQIGVFYAEIPLSASMMLLDSVNTTNQVVLLAGGDRSPFFGTTEAIGFSRLFIDVTAPKPQATATLDSARFQFQILSPTGKSFSENKTITVHQLQESIQDTAYYNFDRLAFDPSPFVSGSFRLTANKDTVVRTALNENFANQIFEELKSGNRTFNDLFAFRDRFPGIAVQGNLDEETSIPIRAGGSTGILLYYHNEGDTTASTYEITTSASRRFNHVRNDRTGTPLEKIQVPHTPYEVGNVVGSKANTGLVIRLDTSPLDQFLDTLQNVTFNQVELVMGPIKEFAESNQPLRYHQMYFLDDNDEIYTRHDGAGVTVQSNQHPQQSVGPDGNIIPAFRHPAGLDFRSDKNVFNQNITAYFNALFRSGLDRRNLMLYPNFAYSLDEQPGPDEYKQSLRQYMVDQNNIKLRIYYSKIR